MPRLMRPLPGMPIKDLERLWLDTACMYEQFDEIVMVDTDWDLMAKELNDRKDEWSPYFVYALGGPEKAKAWNVGSTASGVDWRKGLPALVANYISLSPIAKRSQKIYDRHHKAIAAHNGATQQ